MVLLALLAVAILFGLGFADTWLFVVAGIVFVLWLAGWVIRPSGGRWYRW